MNAVRTNTSRRGGGDSPLGRAKCYALGRETAANRLRGSELRPAAEMNLAAPLCQKYIAPSLVEMRRCTKGRAEKRQRHIQSPREAVNKH